MFARTKRSAWHHTPVFALMLLVLTLLLCGAPQGLYAQPAEAISFQGRLTNDDGTPVKDATYSVRFHLYANATGGSPRWEEAHTVETIDGVFSVLLGTETPLPLDSSDPALYLALTVDGEELRPRTPLSAVPYAMQATRAQRLTDGALVAGANVTIEQQEDGSWEVSAAGGPGGGLSSVTSDGTLEGAGTSGSPLGLADASVTTSKVEDEAITGEKIADDALVAGTNVTITRQAGGSLEVASVGGGGLAQVASDATLTGYGTSDWPLAVSVPLVLTTGVLSSNAAIRGEHGDDNWGELGVPNGGVLGHSSSGPGVYGSSNSNYGVYGSSSSSNGVYGNSLNGTGVRGVSSNSYGVHGQSTSSFGVYGVNSNKWGALGGTNYGVFGVGGSGFAAGFSGDVTILGNVAKSSGSFKIDHPLDPANKYLAHSFVESPDMMNVYNGNITTDASGEAVVTLPDYFEALNRDFRYQLTVIGQFAQAIIAEKIQGNRFVIRTDVPNVEVSWQVTGIRQDAWANEHRIVVEEDKPAEERGFYLHPRLFGQSEERSILWARDPEMMRAIQEMPARLEDEQ